MGQTLERFEVTADHLKLLRQMRVGWQDCEFGAPEIDPKRPYGNGDVLNDVAYIVFGHEGYDPEVDEADEERLHRLHRDTETVLQIVLSTGTMEPGIYELTARYSSKWKRLEAPHV